jgi:hypothetical protein
VQDCLYLDRERLLNVLEETGGIPRKFKADIELSSAPKVTMSSQENAARANELISTAIARLFDNRWIGSHRPRTPGLTSELIRELTRAQKFTVPPLVQPTQHESPGFNFWVSYDEWHGKRVASLCLLEGYHGTDGKPIDMWPFSTYSCLMSLVHYARGQVTQSVLGPHIPDRHHGYADKIARQKTPSLTQHDNVKELAWEFATDTERLLTSLGCFASQTRHVDVLYRVREYGYEGGRSDGPFAVFGYPIWVLDAGIETAAG